MNKNSDRARASAAALAIAIGAALAACGGGGGSSAVPTPTPTPTPDPTPTPVNGPAWPSYGRDAQHAANSGIATQNLSRIVWQTPVDTAPQYSPQGYLLVHYGSPVISGKNTVVIPVKRAAAALYKIEARNGTTGTLMWSMDSDYVMPANNWTPTYNVTLTSASKMVAPAIGGRVIVRDDVDSATAASTTVAFYGDAVYTANKAALDAGVKINTPITVDTAGNMYFGFMAAGGNPANLKSGLARLGADGKGSWIAATDAASDAAILKVAMSSAPALSVDQKTVYVSVNGTNSVGYLVALDSATLAVKAKVKLLDPDTNAPSRVSDDSTSAPTVGPDGDVYYGVLEPVYGAHNAPRLAAALRRGAGARAHAGLLRLGRHALDRAGLDGAQLRGQLDLPHHGQVQQLRTRRQRRLEEQGGRARPEHGAV
jgi:hypothetical protein